MVSYRPKYRFILYKEMIMRCCYRPEHHILLYNTERYWRTYILETWFLHAFSVLGWGITIKIDSTVAFRAFNFESPKPGKTPSEEECRQAARDLDAFTASVWQVSPWMYFIVEATATTPEELARVRMLKADDARVAFQGQHLRNRCVLVCRWR